AHCTWGKEYGRAGGGDWSPTRFEQWEGDNEFDYQFEALLNIICDFEISAGDSFRDLKVKMGWMPPDSKLAVKYEEKWSNAADNRALAGEILITDKLNPTNSALTAYVDGKNGIKVSMNRAQLSSRDPDKGTFKTNRYRDVSDDREEIIASGQLTIMFEGMGNAQVPHAKSTHKGWRKKTIYED